MALSALPRLSRGDDRAVLLLLCTNVVASRPARALVATIASQPALLFAYSLWGGVKELAAAWVLALLAALLAPLVLEERGGDQPWALLPIAVTSATVLGVLSIGGGVWLVPALIAVVIVLMARHGLLAAVRRAAIFLAMGAVLSIPTLSRPTSSCVDARRCRATKSWATCWSP